ncbi:hypothetical protein Tco_1327717 [Tanacetum coccineum]
MLVEKKYPLRKEVLKQMLKLKLESEEDSTMALELIKFVKKILAEHKNWLVHKQTACGKDFLNPFMVDNLPKIIGFSTHLASVVKSWLVHDQTVHGAPSGLHPYHFTYPERKLTMEDMLYKFLDEGKREHEEMREFSSLNHNEPVESNEVLANDQPQKTNEPDAQPSDKIQMPPIPFPRRLRKEKEETQQKKFLENLKQLHINLPFIEALAQMPKYAKFIKLPSKEKDPGSFTIPCDIGQLHINNTLADLGASISLMPNTMYEKLGLDQSIKRPPTEDDECYGIDDLDDTINAEAQKLLANKEPDSFLSRGLEKSIDQSDLEGCEPVEYKTNNDSDSDEPIRRIASINMSYPVAQETEKPVEVEREHLYLDSANEIDEKKPKLKYLPHHLEYAYMHGDKSFPIIISSELSDKEKVSLLQVLEKRKGAIA